MYARTEQSIYQHVYNFAVCVCVCKQVKHFRHTLTDSMSNSLGSFSIRLKKVLIYFDFINFEKGTISFKVFGLTFIVKLIKYDID